jgi:hypothetical protein
MGKEISKKYIETRLSTTTCGPHCESSTPKLKKKKGRKRYGVHSWTPPFSFSDTFFPMGKRRRRRKKSLFSLY